MKGLILAIQTELQTIANVRNSDVFLSPDPDIIPEGCSFPCIGIKDGRVGRSELPGSVTEKSLPVEIIVYEKLIRDEKSILSVLDKTEECHEKLKDNALGGYVKAVTPGDETPIQLMYRKKSLILRKRLNYEYEREEG